MESNEQGEAAYRAAVSRAQENGLMWCNDVFRFNDQRMTLFKKVRISKLEIIWAVVVLVAWCGIASLLYLILSWNSYAKIIFSPFAWFPEGIFLGYFFGRRIPHMSPLRKRTGEGTSVWLQIQVRRATTRLSSWLNQPVTYNRVVTYARNRRQVVECIEWIGTARAPYMPPYDPNYQEWDDTNDIHILPRGRALPYSYRVSDLVIEPSERHMCKVNKRAARHNAKVTKKVERRNGARIVLDKQTEWKLP